MNKKAAIWLIVVAVLGMINFFMQGLIFFFLFLDNMVKIVVPLIISLFIAWHMGGRLPTKKYYIYITVLLLIGSAYNLYNDISMFFIASNIKIELPQLYVLGFLEYPILEIGALICMIIILTWRVESFNWTVLGGVVCMTLLIISDLVGYSNFMLSYILQITSMVWVVFAILHGVLVLRNKPINVTEQIDKAVHFIKDHRV